MPRLTRRSLGCALLLMTMCAGTPAEAQQSGPRPFELLPGERTSVSFSVAAPGKVTVDVQARGEPLLLSVTGPDGQLQEQTGSGTFAMTLDVTAARLSAGNRVWTAALRTVRGAAAPAATSRGSKATASGTLQVTGPLVSDAAMVAMLRPQVAAMQAAMAAMNAPNAQGTLPDMSAAARASLAQQIDATHAQQQQALTARLSPATLARIQQRGGMSVTRSVTPAMQAGITIAGIRPNPAATQPSGGGVSRVGTSTNAAATPLGPLTLSSLSSAEGDPGTPVLFEGSGFGADAGEVHFIVANGRDVKAPFTAWTETQVLSQVPSVDGIPAFNGYAYLLRSDSTRSSMRPFAFKPIITIRQVCVTDFASSDFRIGTPGAMTTYAKSVSHPPPSIVLPFVGFAGYDEFNVDRRLRAGFQVVQVRITGGNGCGSAGPTLGGLEVGGVYVVESRIGTDSPYVKVRWWLDTASIVSYTVTMLVQGPAGMPHF